MDTPTTSNQEIKSLLLPLQQHPLLLPMACLAEVIDYIQPESIQEDNHWYLGNIDWRGVTVPLMAFERINEQQFTSHSITTRIAILKKTLTNTRYSFYGLIIQGVPQPLTLGKQDILPSNEVTGPAERRQAIINGLPAIIPNLASVEHKLAGIGNS